MCSLRNRTFSLFFFCLYLVGYCIHNSTHTLLSLWVFVCALVLGVFLKVSKWICKDWRISMYWRNELHWLLAIWFSRAIVVDTIFFFLKDSHYTNVFTTLRQLLLQGSLIKMLPHMHSSSSEFDGIIVAPDAPKELYGPKPPTYRYSNHFMIYV